MFDDSADDAGVVFRDMMTLLLAGVTICTALVLPHIHPQAMRDAAAKETAPGNVIIEAVWDPALDTDVDLWVQGPGDVPVGYSNKGGGLFNLLRDDLGLMMDVSGTNYEISYARGVLAGEYTVNLQLYRHVSGQFPVAVQVTASTKPDVQTAAKQIVSRKAELVRDGQELTVFRFTLDRKGQLVPDSINDVFKPLRHATQ